MKTKSALFAAAAFAVVAGANAQSANLDVIGTINPSACTISIAGGAVDLGARTVSEVMGFPQSVQPSATTRMYPGLYPRTLNVVCPTPMTVGVAVETQHQPLPFGQSGDKAGDVFNFGIKNTVTGTTIGNFVLGTWARVSQVNGADAPNKLISVGVSGVPNWTQPTDTDTEKWHFKRGNTFAYSSTSAPVALTDLAVPFDTYAFVSEPLLQSEGAGGITLAGRATFTLRVL